MKYANISLTKFKQLLFLLIYYQIIFIIMINPYKRLDVFKCKSIGHSKFEHRVSVHHVMRIKNCYPQGCIYFLWRCQLLNKGQSCIKGYNHVGRNCFGCKNYFDEKIHNQPVLLLLEEKYAQFLEELEDFEDWLESIVDKYIDIQGTIQSVKPALTKVVHHRSSHLNLNGYFLHFDEAFIDTVHWEDHCYAFIYPDQQERFQFAPDDSIEFRAKAELNDGRLVFKKLNYIEFLSRSRKPTWTKGQALVVKHTTISFTYQPTKCLHCEQGVLVDVIDKSRPRWERSRELFCLKSFPDSDVCYYAVEKKLTEEIDRCPDEIG